MTLLLDDEQRYPVIPDLQKKIEERVLMLQKELSQIHKEYITGLEDLENQKDLKEHDYHKKREELMDNFIEDLQSFIRAQES